MEPKISFNEKFKTLQTDRNNSKTPIVQSYVIDKKVCDIVNYKTKRDGTESREFERLTINADGGIWLYMAIDEIREDKNGTLRRKVISVSIDKKQALFMLENLKEIINGMVD